MSDNPTRHTTGVLEGEEAELKRIADERLAAAEGPIPVTMEDLRARRAQQDPLTYLESRMSDVIRGVPVRDLDEAFSAVRTLIERQRTALQEIARLGTLVAHDLQGRVEAGKVMAVQRLATTAQEALNAE